MTEAPVERMLLQHLEGPRAGATEAFCQPTVMIGRAPDCHLAFPSERGVSGHHAVIRQGDGLIELEDSNSTNGTFVNDVRVDRCALKHLDTIRLGSIGPLMRLELPDRDQPGEPLAPTPPPASRLPPPPRPATPAPTPVRPAAAAPAAQVATPAQGRVSVLERGNNMAAAADAAPPAPAPASAKGATNAASASISIAILVAMAAALVWAILF